MRFSIFSWPVLGFAFFAVLFFSACNNDPCKDVVCGSNSTCVDGACVCDAGYVMGTNGLCALPDPCAGVVCGDHGTCNGGNCVCDLGYEKDANNLCNVESRAKFLGTFAVTDDCSNSGMSNYTVVVTSGTSGVTEVRITNFYGLFTNSVAATVSGDSIFIARQQPDGDNIFVEGEGQIVGGVIDFGYTISDETNTSSIVYDDCGATWE